jgi:hypothetical protein
MHPYINKINTLYKCNVWVFYWKYVDGWNKFAVVGTCSILLDPDPFILKGRIMIHIKARSANTTMDNKNKYI